MKHFFIPRLDLQLFAEGGAPAGDGGAEGTGVSAPAAGVQNKGAKGNPLANVVYGKQPQESAPAAGVQNTDPKSTQPTQPEQQPDRNAEFDAMIKGDYKDAYNKNVQNILQQRLKGANEVRQKYEAATPLLELIAERYGVQADDVEGMIKALEDDDALYEQAAMDKNMDVKDYKRQLKLERENARLRSNEAKRVKDQAWSDQVAEWARQTEELKSEYPNINLSKEMENTDFREKLFKGYTVADAYLTTHKDDVVGGAMQYTAQAVEKKIANKIAAGGSRPAENGTSGQSGVVIKSDPSKWTKQDREEVRRRAARGERIML